MSTSFVSGLLIGSIAGCLVAIVLQALIDAVLARPHPLDLLVKQKKRIAEIERQIAGVRRYLIPMQSWPDLDDHAKGHIAMMLHITNQKQE